MQTPTIFQFQAALLGTVRALPAAAAPLQRGTSSALAIGEGNATLAAGEATVSPSGTVVDEPIYSIICGLPAVLLNAAMLLDAGPGTAGPGTAGPGTSSDGMSWDDTAWRSELVLLQAISAELMGCSSTGTAHAMTHRALHSQILPRLEPALAAVDVAWPSDGATGWQLYAVESVSHNPVTAALAALLQCSESHDLTVRLAQHFAQTSSTQKNGSEPELAGAIAGFLWGLYRGLHSPPDTEAEQLTLSLAQQLWGHWAGVGHIAVISLTEPTVTATALAEAPAVTLP